jgi:hypothetical protein
VLTDNTRASSVTVCDSGVAWSAALASLVPSDQTGLGLDNLNEWTTRTWVLPTLVEVDVTNVTRLHDSFI